MAGAPTKFNKARADAICESLRNGNTRTCAAEANGISRETLRLWLADNLAFLGEVEKAEADAEEAMATVVKRAAVKNWCAAAWWLERRRRDDYGKQEKIEHSGPGGGPLRLEYVNDWRRRDEQDDSASLPAPGAAESPTPGETP